MLFILAYICHSKQNLRGFWEFVIYGDILKSKLCLCKSCQKYQNTQSGQWFALSGLKCMRNQETESGYTWSCSFYFYFYSCLESYYLNTFLESCHFIFGVMQLTFSFLFCSWRSFSFQNATIVILSRL